MVKRLLLLLIALLFFNQRGNSQSGEDVVKKYSEHFLSYNSIYAKYKFSIIDKNGVEKFSTPGDFYYQWGKFVINTELSDIYCDGESKIIHDKSVDEIIILGHKEDDNNMSENPFVVLTSSLSAYTVEGIDKVNLPNAFNEECYQITLHPKTELDHKSVAMVVGASDYSIKSIVYNSKNGGEYKVDISTILEVETKEDAFFTLDIENLPLSTEVNDLR